MKSFFVPFCQVCSETLVLAIYQRVRPVDSFSPAATNLFVSSTQAVSFSLNLLQPATHTLSVQWATNGVQISGATNLTFALSPYLLGSGSNSVSALVRDNTGLVRNDPTNFLRQAITWTVTQLWLDRASKLTGGQFAFRVNGNASQAVVVQSSTNLVNWTPLKTNFLTGGSFWYTNSGPTGTGVKFFRAVTPP
jgi:hypothetical protein